MSLTRTLEQMAASVRECADIEGTSAATRHTNAQVYEYVNRGIAALYRILQQSIPDQRYLSSQAISITSGTATYALGSTFTMLVSVDATFNGVKFWVQRYDLIDRPALSNTSSASSAPYTYRLRGSNIEFMPTPSSAGTANVWFVPAPDQLTAGQAIDTIARLDDYVIWYAAREVATKDKEWQLVQALDGRLAGMRADIEVAARSRDLNDPPGVTNTRTFDRLGRLVSGSSRTNLRRRY